MEGRKQSFTNRSTSGSTYNCEGSIRKNWGLYVLLLPTLIYVLLFLYGPMYGVIIAFKDYNPMQGIVGSPWVGLKYFNDFIGSYNFSQLLSNTLIISIYNFLAGFPIPIVFALMLHYLPHRRLQKTVQTVSFAPHFISTVVIVGMLNVFLSPKTGVLNIFIEKLGQDSIMFLGDAALFIHVYVWSGVWQEMGWASIIYIAARTNVDPALYEAASVDGASKFQKMWHIDLPQIMPIAVTLLILGIGNLMSVGFEKAYLMQNNLNLESSEIISTYVYKIGLLGAQFSYSTAVGLFNSIVNCVLLLATNSISRRFTNTSIW